MVTGNLDLIRQAKTIYSQVASRLGLEASDLSPTQEAVAQLGHRLGLPATWSPRLEVAFKVLVGLLAVVYLWVRLEQGLLYSVMTVVIYMGVTLLLYVMSQRAAEKQLSDSRLGDSSLVLLGLGGLFESCLAYLALELFFPIDRQIWQDGLLLTLSLAVGFLGAGLCHFMGRARGEHRWLQKVVLDQLEANLKTGPVLGALRAMRDIFKRFGIDPGVPCSRDDAILMASQPGVTALLVPPLEALYWALRGADLIPEGIWAIGSDERRPS